MNKKEINALTMNEVVAPGYKLVKDMENRVHKRPGQEVIVPFVASPTVGRNEKCTCGSGKKYKKCCGASNNIVEVAQAEAASTKRRGRAKKQEV